MSASSIGAWSSRRSSNRVIAVIASSLVGMGALIAAPGADAASRLTIKVPANPQAGRPVLIAVNGLTRGATAQLFGPTSMLAQGAAPSGFANFRVTFGQPGAIKLRAVELVNGKAGRQVALTVRVQGTAVASAPAVSGTPVEGVAAEQGTTTKVPTTKVGTAPKTTVPTCRAVRQCWFHGLI
jgi:hypothetical protein